MTNAPGIDAKLAFADAILRAEAESGLLTVIGKATVELARKYHAGGFNGVRPPTAPTGPRLFAHVDGGSRGNPGPSGAGIVFHDEAGNRVFAAAYFLGDKSTCNQAEFAALNRCIATAITAGACALNIRADSKLMVEQVNGRWRVKNVGLKPLHALALAGLKKIPRWTMSHVPREQNQAADKLANLAMDLRRDSVVVDKLLHRTADDTAAA